MFKPLLRTLPSLTGNIKLACEINDYTNEGNIYSTYIRSASLQPLQNNLYNRCISVNLVNGMWEYDVAKFYKYYSNYFYKQNFTFLYDDFAKLDMTSYNSNTDSRNKDYEFGCKHISYNNTGYMFDFYAPIYINNVEDMPDYFEIKLSFENGEHKIIRININTESNLNYLKVYVEKYLNKINRNVAYFISNTGRMIYYGIDVNNGGLVDIEDSHMSKYLKENTTINNFDSELCAGFMNNKLIMRQILPLSFHFNIEDILSTYDKLYFIGHKVKISGYYFKNSKQCKFYDFDINYSNKSITDYTYNAQYQRFITENRLSNGTTTNYNILDNDSIFCLHEKYIKNYYYTNALTPMYGSWKMMFSSDSCPYITNVNYVYTNESTGLYGQFPKLFINYDVDEYAQLSGTNLTLYSDRISNSDSDEVKEHKKLFRNIQNTYISSWYTIINKYGVNDDIGVNDNAIGILNDLNNWFKVENNYAYYKGILYNFNNCEYTNNIDYFGVFVKPTYSEIDSATNLYTVAILSDYEESTDKSQYGDICVNEQLHDQSTTLSLDYNKSDYVTDVYDFDNNYIYQDGKILNGVNGAKTKNISDNVILSKYTSSNLYNIDDIYDKQLYITVDSVNTGHNDYVKLIDLFNVDFSSTISCNIYDSNVSSKRNVLKCIIKDFIIDNGLNLSNTNTFVYNLLRFSTLMLQKTFQYNADYINTADTFNGFLLNYNNDAKFAKNVKINLNTSTNDTKHKWNIFVDTDGQIYEANVYISKNSLLSTIQYLVNYIQSLLKNQYSKNKLIEDILTIVNKTYSTTNSNVVKEVLDEVFDNSIIEDSFNNILNDIDSYEFIFHDINLRNDLTLTEYYNAINSIYLAQSLKESYDSIVENRWPLTSIKMLLGHINGNTDENPQLNDSSSLLNIHFIEKGYVEKIEKLSNENPFNVDSDNTASNYNKVLFIDAAYINRYEKHNSEFYTKYYDYIKTVFGDPYNFYASLFDINILRMQNSRKTIEQRIIDYYENDQNVKDFDSHYNVGNYTDNLYKAKGPQYFFNTVNRLISNSSNIVDIIEPLDSTILDKLKYSFNKFSDIDDVSYQNLCDKYDKYFPTILTQELSNIAPSFDLNYWDHNTKEQQDLQTYFTTVLSRIICNNSNLDRLKFEINNGAPITFKSDVLITNENSINQQSDIYNILKTQYKYNFNLSKQFSDNTESYFYKYNMNENNIYNILSTHAMSERFDFDDIESMNPTYLSYPSLYDNVMKLFVETDDNDKSSIYLFVGSPFLILPNVLPFENDNRGIYINYSNTNTVKFGIIPFIEYDNTIRFDINNTQNIFDLLTTETSANKIEQYYDVNQKQINVLFDNICKKVNDINYVHEYDKYNAAKYNSNSNALLMFTDLGISASNITTQLNKSNEYITSHPSLYVYPNTFICSEFATLQDISAYYRNINDYTNIEYKNNIGIALVSSLKNSYLHNTRNFAEVLKFYKNNDTNVNISNIYEYVSNTINNLIDQSYCYDKTWKTFLDELYNTIINKYEGENYLDKENRPELEYLNYILCELILLATSYRKIEENLNITNKKYFDQYPVALKEYINDGWNCKIKITDDANWLEDVETTIYDIIWPLAQSMNVYRQLLETIKLYKVDCRELDTEVSDNNDMLQFKKVYDGEYYSKLMSVETENKLSKINTLAIQYNNKYSFKSVVNKKYVNDNNGASFNYFENIHNIIQIIIDQCENLNNEDKLSNNYTSFYCDLYSKKELLPIDEHLLTNMIDNNYQYYIYELCDNVDRHCATIKYSKSELDEYLSNNLFENITNDIIKISNADHIYYAKLFNHTESDVYKNNTDKNMLLNLLNDKHIFKENCDMTSIYGQCVNNNDYNIYRYKKDNMLFATKLDETNYSILSSIIKSNIINIFDSNSTNSKHDIYDMLNMLSNMIYILFDKFDNNSIHNDLFKDEFVSLVYDIIDDIYDLINTSLSNDRTHIDFKKDIYSMIYGDSAIYNLNTNCIELSNKITEWYVNYLNTNTTIDISFENLILDTAKNNRALSIAKDLENFKQQISDSENNIDVHKLFRHISINICKNLPYSNIISQIIEHIYYIYSGSNIDNEIQTFCDNIINNINDAKNRYVLTQLLNYCIVYCDVTLYSYVMNNEIVFDKLSDNINEIDNIVDIVDNIDNNLHITKRTNNDGTITTYAYYCLNLNITNSSLHYNIGNSTSNMIMTFKSINNKSIESNKRMFINKYFNLLCPLLKVDMFLSILQQSKVLQKPAQFQQKIVINAIKNNVEDYQTCYYKYDNGEHYIKELERSYGLYKSNNSRNMQAITLNRYMNYIEPLIRETDTILDFKSQLFKTNNTIYNGQNLFTENININKYNPIIVFNKLDQYNTISLVDDSSQKYYIYPDLTVKQYEYKHFNDNNLYILENSFEYESHKLYTYNELLKVEDDSTVYNLFKNYIIKRHNNLTLDENEILFLFNKYNVTFKSNFEKLDMTQSNKLYTLKYIFSLK